MEDNGAAHFPSDDSISTTEGRRRRRRLLCQSNDSADGLRRSKKRPRCSHANLCIAVVFTDTERERQGTPLKSTFISLLARGRKQGGSNAFAPNRCGGQITDELVSSEDGRIHAPWLATSRVLLATGKSLTCAENATYSRCPFSLQWKCAARLLKKGEGNSECLVQVVNSSLSNCNRNTPTKPARLPSPISQVHL